MRKTVKNIYYLMLLFVFRNTIFYQHLMIHNNTIIHKNRLKKLSHIFKSNFLNILNKNLIIMYFG